MKKVTVAKANVKLYPSCFVAMDGSNLQFGKCPRWSSLHAPTSLFLVRTPLIERLFGAKNSFFLLCMFISICTRGGHKVRFLLFSSLTLLGAAYCIKFKSGYGAAD